MTRISGTAEVEWRRWYYRAKAPYGPPHAPSVAAARTLHPSRPAAFPGGALPPDRLEPHVYHVAVARAAADGRPDVDFGVSGIQRVHDPCRRFSLGERSSRGDRRRD